MNPVDAPLGLKPKTALSLAAIPALTTLITLWWLISSGRWNLFGIWTLDSTTGAATGFGDLAFITATADCFNADSAVNPIDFDTCDPYGRPFTPYGIIPGRFLAFFNLGFEQNTILGIALAGFWVALVFWLTYRTLLNWTASTIQLSMALIAITLFAVSPTALLAVERGTLDILVTAFAAIGLLAFATRSTLKHVGGAVLLFLSVILKYFAVGVFAPFFAPKRWSITATIATAVTAVFMLFNLDNLRTAQEIAQADTLSTSRIMFSSTTGLVTLLVDDPLAFNPPADQELNSTLIGLSGFVIFAILVALLTFILTKAMNSQGKREPIPSPPWFFIVGGSFALTIPYFLGPSNDYRLVVLLIPLAGLLMWIGQKPALPLRITLWIMVAATTIAGLTGSAMKPNEFGFIVPKSVIVFGDAALATTLAFGVALFLYAWLPRKNHSKENVAI